MNTKNFTQTHRILHWVFRVGHLKSALAFFENVLKMKVLRHEEFPTACPAECNGPYNTSWSKTMVGYGPESDYFALEIIHNNGIENYEYGNDWQYIALNCAGARERANQFGYQVEEQSQGNYLILGPENYKFLITHQKSSRVDPFETLTLKVSNLDRAIKYWSGILNMQTFAPSTTIFDTYPQVTLGYTQEQIKIQLIEFPSDQPVTHAQGYGRIAIACPSVDPIYKKIIEAGEKILRPPMFLSTPGKVDARVIILADPDGYEICFVEAESFYVLASMEI